MNFVKNTTKKDKEDYSCTITHICTCTGFHQPQLFFSGCMVSVFEIKIEMDFGYEVNSMATQPKKFKSIIKMSRFEDINNRMHNDALMDDEFMNFIETHFSELEIFQLYHGTMDLVLIWKAWFDVKNSSGEDKRYVDHVLSQQIMKTKKSYSRMHKSENKAVLKNYQQFKTLLVR